MKKYLFASAILGLSLMLLQTTGCKREVTLDPPSLHLGQDTCFACGMIVSDERYAAAIVQNQNGERKQFIFDDLGEMLRFTPPAASQTRYWAHDVESKQWIDATTAHYVRSPANETPMLTGVVAYATQVTAEAAAKTHDTTAKTFDEARKPAASPAAASSAPASTPSPAHAH